MSGERMVRNDVRHVDHPGSGLAQDGKRGTAEAEHE